MREATELLATLPRWQAQLVSEYVANGGKAGDAARACGLQAVDAAAALARPEVRQVVDALAADVADAVNDPELPAANGEVVIDAAWVLRELVHQATASVRDFATLCPTTGRVSFDVTQDNLDALDGMSEVTVEDTRINGALIDRKLKFKRPDRLKALELIGKHVAVRAFAERIEVENVEAEIDEIRAGRRRLQTQPVIEGSYERDDD